MRILDINNNIFRDFTVVVMTLCFATTLSLSSLHAAGSARDFLKAGIKSVENKNYDQAIQHLTKAINLATLSPRQVAKALYQRGIAYNKKGEPARGIADLTRALFFKKIPPEQKSQILKARAESYRSVGLLSKSQADLRSAGVSGNSAVNRSRTANITLPKKPELKPIITNSRPLEKVSRPQKQATTTGWGVSIKESERVREVKPKKTAGLYEQRNLTTQSSNYNENTQKNTEYSSSLFRKPPKRVKPTDNSQAQSGWGNTTQVNARTDSNRQQNVASFKSANYTIPSSGSGRYRLQLAAVSSENDAQQAWYRLQSKHSTLLSAQTPDFQKVDLGSGRSMVRIQIGPFADKSQTLQLCNSFKAQGLDCFLVVR